MKEKILIADDDFSIRRLVERLLAREEYESLNAGDGQAALDVAFSQAPDMVLLDIGMPKKNGWQVLAELRRNLKTRLMPVIMLTGRAEVSDEVGSLDQGADDYVKKPFELRELLARIKSLLRRNRQDLAANPLTKLPGSPVIEEEVNRRIRGKTPFAFFYIDIDRFKAYNDVYGFAKGDEVIRATGDILVRGLGEDSGDDGFVGHVGGDDFVIIASPAQALALAGKISASFDRRRDAFYNPSDRARGYIETTDRRGLKQRFPLLSLSMGIVTSERQVLDHYAKVVRVASEMKAYCKADPRQRSSRFALDLRCE